MIVYRILLPLLFSAVIIRALWALCLGKENRQDFFERVRGPNTEGPTIWIHAASVGELNAARPLIEHFAKSHKILVTTTTITGRDTVLGWKAANVTVGLSPLDSTFLTKRLIRSAQIMGLIIVENELWPNRIMACQALGVPVAMINARMSEGSLRIWNKFPNTAKQILSKMVAIIPQSDIFAERIIALGAIEEAVFPSLNLKALYRPVETPLPDAIKDMAKHDWLLAAATHQGEEEIILDAFQRAHQTEPELRLIIAPRHPERGDVVAKLARNAGFTVASRSSNDQPNAQIYIADTLHEMHLWYQICAKVFVGGSLAPKGGHTPYEPSAYGCWIIHGPFVSNFEDAYQEFKSRKMCEQIEDAATLAQAFLNTPTFSNEQVTFENSRSGEAELVFQRLEKIMHISG